MPPRHAHAPTSCDDIKQEFDEVSVTLQLVRDPSFEPYAAVAEIAPTVDGAVLREAPWANRALRMSDQVLVSCTPGVDTGIAPGIHTVGYRAFIAGVDAPLTVEQTVDFDCGTEPADAGGASSAASDAGTASCAMSRSHDAVFPALVGLAFLAAARWRRVRRRAG